LKSFHHKVIGSGESPTSKQITWVKTIVDNQGVEKSYIGGHKGLHKGHKGRLSTRKAVPHANAVLFSPNPPHPARNLLPVITPGKNQ
jgi:hypothetical protein